MGSLPTPTDDSQRRSSSHKVVTPPHPKDTACDNRISNVVDARAAGVEEHGDGGYELTGKDNKYTLPPIQAYTNHSTTKSPISKGQSKIESHEIPPPPCPLSVKFTWEGLKIIQVRFSGGVGSKSSLLHDCFVPGWPCWSSAVSWVSMKYLKPSRLRKAFLNVVAFAPSVARSSVAPIVADLSG
jgi:hypothetical protein